ncbi:translation initiation factor IF-2 [Candidatus Micrarchaeota archaeon]|nr:MAG: translation initiation factor IF-2 [Candidatus Micrarchaeota archaeon]
MPIRSPIICVLGHVDHGKTMILDRIRGTAITAKEAGGITQHVGASFIPKAVIESKCKDLLEQYKFKLRIPGLLFIDTPGHEAFTTLRKRGGSIADLAVLVIDISQGIQPQTIESIDILRSYKTPFVVAANKIDLIDGWEAHENACFMKSFQKQRDFVKENLDKKIYEIIGQLGERNFDSERFDRVKDVTKEVLIIPVSAKTGEGIKELLMFLAALSQKFIKDRLEISPESAAKGTVLEIKEVKGLGTTADAIIYDGCIREGDTVAMASIDDVVITKIRALLEPAPLEEIRDSSRKFKRVAMVVAAAGVKIAAPNLEKVVAGSPLRVVKENIDEIVDEIRKEISSVIVNEEGEGVIARADTLGSLEAMINLFSKEGIPISSANIGMLTKLDLTKAETMRQKNRYLGVLFAFNVAVPREIEEEAKKQGIKIFCSDVIYKLIEDYKEWLKEEREKEKMERLKKYILPAKIKVLPGFIFRASKPAIVGIEVLEGTIRPQYPLMNAEGKEIGVIRAIQEKNQSISMAEKGDKVAVSIDGAVVGRNLYENDVLFTSVPVKQLYELRDKIGNKDLIDEIIRIQEVKKR